MARSKDSVPVKPAQERAARRSLTGAARLRSRLADVLRDLLSNPNMAIGFFILVAASVVAIFAPVIASRDPLDLDPYARLLSPSTEFYFGTDQLGRDTFSRTLHGARLSLRVGLFVAVLTMSFGTVIGLVTGYYRTLDNIVMRFMDSLMAVPSFLLAIALVAILGASLANVVIALTVVETPRVVRLTRGSVLSLRERDFVQGAEAVGANAPRILAVHIFPNVAAPLLVQGTYIFALAILVEAGLSFLGAGVPPYIPSWGNMMGEAKTYIHLAAWLAFFPGLFLSLTVLGANLVGDGLRDKLDPRLRHTL